VPVPLPPPPSATDPSTITIVFTEPVDPADVGNVIVTGGTLGDPTTTDNTTFDVVFTPDPDGGDVTIIFPPELDPKVQTTEWSGTQPANLVQVIFNRVTSTFLFIFDQDIGNTFDITQYSVVDIETNLSVGLFGLDTSQVVGGVTIASVPFTPTEGYIPLFFVDVDKGVIITAANGSRFRLTVEADGSLTTTVVH
jgi:hypothetical protein